MVASLGGRSVARAAPRSPKWPVLASYRRVFAHPGALAFSATGLVARLPISMMTLGIVLLVSTLTGSYALAGQVSAAYIIGNAAFAVPHGRLADRFGQRRVLYVDAVVFALASALMIVSITDDWALPLAAPARRRSPAPPSRRSARWSGAAGRTCSTVDSERHTAFAVEGVADEVVFVTGPALVTFLVDRLRAAVRAGGGARRRHGRDGRPGAAAPDRAPGPPARPDRGPGADALGAAGPADRRRAGPRQPLRRPRGGHRGLRRRRGPQGGLRADARRLLPGQPGRRRGRRAR